MRPDDPIALLRVNRFDHAISCVEGRLKMEILDSTPDSLTERRDLLIRARRERDAAPKPINHREYIVPILMKALQIVELLCSSSEGLRVDEIHRITRISKSSIYRIVRTLAAAEYLDIQGKGVYKLAAFLETGSWNDRQSEELCDEWAASA